MQDIHWIDRAGDHHHKVVSSDKLARRCESIRRKGGTIRKVDRITKVG